MYTDGVYTYTVLKPTDSIHDVGDQEGLGSDYFLNRPERQHDS